MKIAVDVDETLANLIDAIMVFHNETYGTSLTRDQFRSYDFNECWGGTFEEAVQKVHEFFLTPYFTNIKPLPGAIEAITTLKANHDLYIVSARQLVIEKETHSWLERHFPNKFKGVHLTNAYGLSGPIRRKKEVCQELGLEMLIDDSLTNALECAELGIPVLMLDYPWNQRADLPANIKRVSSWEEILERISALANLGHSI